MPTIVARHKVGDFDTWLKGHKDRENIFAPAINGFQTFQDQDDPNSIVLVIDVNDMGKFIEIIEDSKSKEFQELHTVIRPITISMQVEV